MYMVLVVLLFTLDRLVLCYFFTASGVSRRPALLFVILMRFYRMYTVRSFHVFMLIFTTGCSCLFYQDIWFAVGVMDEDRRLIPDPTFGVSMDMRFTFIDFVFFVGYM